jgi:hypothetical protein
LPLNFNCCKQRKLLSFGPFVFFSTEECNPARKINYANFSFPQFPTSSSSADLITFINLQSASARWKLVAREGCLEGMIFSYIFHPISAPCLCFSHAKRRRLGKLEQLTKNGEGGRAPVDCWRKRSGWRHLEKSTPTTGVPGLALRRDRWRHATFTPRNYIWPDTFQIFGTNSNNICTKIFILN